MRIHLTPTDGGRLGQNRAMTHANSAATVLERTTAEALNTHCFCRTLNQERLHEQFEACAQPLACSKDIRSTHPHLFASTVVFMSERIRQQIESTVAAIERVATLPGYQAQALARVDDVAQIDFGLQSACMGYDFHVGPDGAHLIEINTNAGGAMLNVALTHAQQSHCDELDWNLPPTAQRDTLKQQQFDMFATEWRLQRGDAPWRQVLIVDDDPQNQYLAPEFELYRQLFAEHGVQAQIADAQDLQWRDGQLSYQGQTVQMVYNRLTDFYLTEPRHAALRHAYQAGAVVLTPHPRAHALLADKRNLMVLSQDALLAAWGASAADRKILAECVPTTRLVTPDRADEFWQHRRQLFFKPVAGYGAKAAYRGDKLTRRVWSDILSGEFVAQQLVPPGQRMIEVDGVATDLKFDVRAYTYAGRVQLLAARIYAGQTTNFRTPGGGFAPVLVVPTEGIG